MLENIKLIVGLLPILTQLIKSAEQAMPGKGQGVAKLEMVRQILDATDATLSAAWPLIEKVIGILVATFNKTGQLHG